MRQWLFLLLLLPLLLPGACTVPPPEAYTTVGGAGRPERAVDLGVNTIGESCVQAASSTTTADIYCGTWQQPSARVRDLGPAAATSLAQAAASGPWRTGLDAAYVCPPPTPTTLDGMQALQMTCTRRIGGWPNVAILASSGTQLWAAEGVPSALPAMQRSIAVLSGRTTPTILASAAVDALQAERSAARARATGDVREFDSLMTQGARANLADAPVAAEGAYAAALALQQKALGANNPNVADPMMHVALQLSNQGRFAEAAALFARADALAAQPQNDPALVPRLHHYEALDELNQNHLEPALADLRRAEAEYLAILGPDGLRSAAPVSRTPGRSGFELPPAPPDRQTQITLSGLLEVRRYQAVVLRDMGRSAESAAALRAARDLAQTAGLEQPELTARLLRSAALQDSLDGDSPAAIAGLRRSADAFAKAYPGSRPLALVGLLEAREMVRDGQAVAAVPLCRSSMQVLIEIKSAFDADRMAPCLDALAAAAAGASDPAARQGFLADMFQAAQLTRSSTTSQQIQAAAARLSEGSRDQKVGQAIREEQDAIAQLADIRTRREALLDAQRRGAPVNGDPAALEAQENAAVANLAERESTLQAAAPNYAQLVQQAASASDLLHILKPGEAFAAITLTPDGGWTFLLRDGQIQVGRIEGGRKSVDRLVTRIRAAMEPSMPAFDTEAASSLYQALFGGVKQGMEGLSALTIAPTGSLLTLPFEVLLTAPANPSSPAGASLGSAPWLVRQMAIAHVPSAANFVSLRRASGGSHASQAWFGFGDFHPVSLAQARRSFPPSCGDSAELLAHLPPLPGAKTELDVVRKILGGGPEDELLGARFTAPAVERESLENYRILHFATHAVLPSDLKCQSEPALITSAPANAPDAAGALLKASDLAKLKLDADLVILSACNSGGAEGESGAAESLSALARSFFFGGARALMVTHWEVNDQAATFLVAETLRRARAEPALGYAAALRASQLEILQNAGGSIPAEFAHPFLWAPFAIIGQAR